MKRLFQFVLLPLLFFCHVNAEDMNFQIQAPNMDMLLPQVNLPQNQIEAMPRAEEMLTLDEYFKCLNRGEYDKALAFLRKEEGSVLELIENGDPDGKLRKLAVVGGRMPFYNGTTMEIESGKGYISAYLLYLIGHTYFSLEKYEAAETAFLAALVPLPDFKSVHASLGLLYIRQERYEDAYKHMVHAMELGFNTSGMFGGLGYLNYQRENYWGAAKAFQEALMLEPDIEQWENGLLNSLIRTNQYQSALTLVESMLKKHPDDAHLWLIRANTAYYSEEKEVAFTSLETAIRLGDHRVSNVQVCAALHMELGSIKRAVELLKLGFSKGMDYRYIDQSMNWLEQAEEWDELEHMITWIRAKWDSLDEIQRSNVLMREANISLNEGDKSAAQDALEKAIALDPYNAYALMSLARIHREEGNYNQAELLYRRASEDDLYRENALVSLAQLALDQEDYEDALYIIRDMLKEFPHRTDLNQNIESLEKMVMLQNEN